MLTPSISEANQNPGSQRRQIPGDAGRHPEKVSAGSWQFRRHQATSRGGKNASYKRGVTGSNPVHHRHSRPLNHVASGLSGR